MPLLNSDYNNINQNILEHRSVNNNVFRNSSKAGPQSASTPTISNASCRLTEVEKLKKHNTPAESGVLRSHANTPNGKIAWPNERQLGWQPKTNDKQSNLNYNWNDTDSSWSNDNYNQWNNTGLPLTGLSSSQNWHQQTNYRSQDKGPLLFAPQPQMQRIVSISDV